MLQRLNWNVLVRVLIIVSAINLGEILLKHHEGWIQEASSLVRMLYFIGTRGVLILVITAALFGFDRFLRYITQVHTEPDILGDDFYVTLPTSPWPSYLRGRARLFLLQVLSWLLFLRYVIALAVSVVVLQLSLSYVAHNAEHWLSMTWCANVSFCIVQLLVLDALRHFRVLEAVEDAITRSYLTLEPADTASVQNMVCGALCDVQERLHHQVLVTMNYAGQGSTRRRWFGYSDVVYFQVRARRAGVELIAAKLVVELGPRRLASDLHRVQHHIVDRLVTEIPMQFIVARLR